MKSDESVQLADLVDRSDPRNVYNEIKSIFLRHYPVKQFRGVRRAFQITRDLFRGKYPGYRACNTEYHNYDHTLDALLAAVRLADGYNLGNRPLPAGMFKNLIIATLLHDSGYIQETGDTDGTGAKYTKIHVERSVRFLRGHHSAFMLREDELASIQKMILCTGLSVRTDTMEFSSTEELYAGLMLGTADLLGQMSDRTYLEKLLFLYYEFREAGIDGYNTEFDIIHKTVDFYELTKKRLADENRGVYRYARDHFRERRGIDRNLYMEAIDRHISYLHRIIDDDSSNFRKKLKRATWVEHYRGAETGETLSP